MAVEIYKEEKDFNAFIAKMDGVQAELKSQASRIGGIAEGRLESARSSTQWHKVDLGSETQPSGLTKIEVHRPFGQYASTSYEVSMVVEGPIRFPNAMAIEFGHAPSGVFGPTGRLSHVKTKAPYGLYIMTGAYIQA